MRTWNKKSNIEFTLITIIFSVLVCLFCSVFGLSFAKYTKEIFGVSSGTVARAVVIIGDLSQGEGAGQQSYNLNLKGAHPNMAIEEYDFFVANGTDSSFSEVALSYTIAISSTGYLPLDIVLKDSTANELAVLSPSIHNATGEQTYNFVAGEYISNEYVIAVSWNDAAGYDSHNYAGMVDLISVTVAWEQVD